MRAPKLLDNDNWGANCVLRQTSQLSEGTKWARISPRWCITGACDVENRLRNNFALCDMEYPEEQTMGPNAQPNQLAGHATYGSFLGTATFFTRLCKLQADEEAALARCRGA